jgi:hypothetical protein
VPFKWVTLRGRSEVFGLRIYEAKRIYEEWLFDPTLEELQNAISKADSMLEVLRPIAMRFHELRNSAPFERGGQ